VREVIYLERDSVEFYLCYPDTVESGLIETVANVGDSQDYTTFGEELDHLGITGRFSGQLAGEIRFDCLFALMFFPLFLPHMV